MRGPDERQAILFSYRSIEDRIPADHPLRAMRRLVDPLLVELSPRFQTVYAVTGRPSIPPEQLLRALLLQALYTIRSERQLMEQLDYNLLYRWFVGLTPDDAVWVPTVFSKNRDRLLAGDIAEAFFRAVLALADRHRLLSPDHFTVDGTLLEAWASHQSFQPIEDPPPPPSDDAPPPPAGRNPSVNFRGEKRSNATHRSVTDPDSRLVRKTHHGAAFLGYQASVLTENRHGLIVETDVRAPGYHAEREAGLAMLTRLPPRARRRTLGADKGYDTPEFIAGVRALGVTPHVSPNPHRYRGRSAVDRRTTRHPRLRDQPTPTQARRGKLRLAEVCGDAPQTAPPRTAAGGVDFRVYECSVQSGARALAAGGRHLSGRTIGTTQRPVSSGTPDRGPTVERHCPRRYAAHAQSQL